MSSVSLDSHCLFYYLKFLRHFILWVELRLKRPPVTKATVIRQISVLKCYLIFSEKITIFKTVSEILFYFSSSSQHNLKKTQLASLINIKTHILNKISANKVQECIERIKYSTKQDLFQEYRSFRISKYRRIDKIKKNVISSVDATKVFEVIKPLHPK